MGDIRDLLVDTLEDLGKGELKRFQEYLINGVEDFKKIKRAQLENADRCDTVHKMMQMYPKDGAVKITLTILGKMTKNQTAQELETNYREGLTASSKAQPGSSSNTSSASYADEQRKAQSEELKSTTKSRYNKLKEKTAGQGENCPLKDTYTDLYVVKGWSKKVNTDHEVIKMEAETSRYTTSDTPVKFSEIFSGDSKKLLTLGIAGIGKTVSVQKFALDWAEGKSNTDIDFVFIIPFRELNLLKEEKHSLHDLLLYFYPDLNNLKETGLFHGKCKSLFILDGLDEFRKPLDFKQKKMSDVTQKVCVDVLVTNLIKGALLPSALVWITTRPAAADQIHNTDDFLVTEVRGFTDQQKEEYFRKRISNEDQAGKILSHIKQSKTLYIMCYIPVLCWIMFTVLQDMMKKAEIPKTLTQMYTNFLTIQITKNNTKYNQTQHTDTKKLLETYRDLIVKLAELAFKQLMKGNVMFYEEDLRESSIDVTEASVYSGIFTEILKEESIFHRRKVYCFVHLSFQEFLAAVYVFYCYENKNMKELQCFYQNNRKSFDDLLEHSVGFDDFIQEDSEWSDDDLQKDSKMSDNVKLGLFSQIRQKLRIKHRKRSNKVPVDQDSKRSDVVPLDKLLKAAVDEAVESQNGHLDLFLRFLLGISLKSNQRLLQGLLTQTNKSSEKTTEYIKKLIKRDSDHISTERSINLFLCLYEMNDQSLSREIQEFIKPDKSLSLSPGQCSALAYMLLTSEKVLDELNLNRYNTSEEGYIRLIPALTVCRKAEFADCKLSEQSCECLQSVLESETSSLKELDLSNNDLQDSGVEKLSAGLKSSHCKLEILRLSGCMVTQKGCSSLASALKSNPSHLRELDLTYNHPGESGVKELSDLLEDPHCKLDTLRVEHGGEIRITPGLKKYYCRLTLDPNTAGQRLVLSEENREVKWSYKEQRYSDHPERFTCDQVLSNESVSGRCYWEVEWSRERGGVFISVSYKDIRGKGRSDESVFGGNSQSWSLRCFSFSSSLCFLHNSIKTDLSGGPSSRIGVYVDHSAGTLSFYNIYNNTLTLIHTVHTTFTQPLYAGFRVCKGSVRFCDK